MKSQVNWLDRLVTYFAPRAGAERVKSRLVANYYSSDRISQRLYDGASTGRRTDGWITPSSNANNETKLALSRLRDRSRDLTRNNPIANRALQVIVSNTVGTGIMAKHRGNSRQLEVEMDRLWSSWSGSTSIDLEGRNDFYGLQALVLRTVVESGECLIRKVPVAAADGSVPLKLQVLEPDFLDALKDLKLPDGGVIVQGIEYNAQGARVAYWIFPEHPGSGGTGAVSRRIPADEILHVFRSERPGQARGVPWASTSMVRMRDLDDFMDAQLVKMKVSSCLTAFVTDIEAPIDGSAATSTLGEKLEPGQIEILPSGKDIRFASPPGADGSEQFVTETLRLISASYGISFEAMTNNYSTVNYSSGRMGWIEMSRNVDSWRWGMLIPQFCVPVWGWFAQAAGLTGQSFDGVRAEWSAPRREMIDPTKEISASINAVRGGLISLSEVHRQSGFDSDSLLEEIASDNAKLDALGLILDSDARKTMKAGGAQAYVSDPAADSSVTTEQGQAQ